MITSERAAIMAAADESMREKIDVWVHEDNSITIGVKGANETFTRNEFGELVHRLMQFDIAMGGAE